MGVSLLLLSQTKVSSRRAQHLAWAHPVGRVAAVVASAAGKKNPAGYVCRALEANWDVPPLDPAVAHQVALDVAGWADKSSANVPQGAPMKAVKYPRLPGESDNDWLRRVAETVRAQSKQA